MEDEESSPEAGRGGAPPDASPPRPMEHHATRGHVAPLARLRQARLSEAHSMLLVHALEQERVAFDEEE